jgi:hypothetical protein
MGSLGCGDSIPSFVGLPLVAAFKHILAFSVDQTGLLIEVDQTGLLIEEM